MTANKPIKRRRSLSEPDTDNQTAGMDRRHSDPPPPLPRTRRAVKAEKQKKAPNVILEETVKKLQKLKADDQVLVRKSTSHSWCLCRLVIPPVIHSEGSDGEIRVLQVHVRGPSADRTQTKSGIYEETKFLTGSSVNVSVPEHTAPEQVSGLPTRTIAGEPVQFGKILPNIHIKEVHSCSDRVEYNGSMRDVSKLIVHFWPADAVTSRARTALYLLHA